jgi:hypothetical protein
MWNNSNNKATEDLRSAFGLTMSNEPLRLGLRDLRGGHVCSYVENDVYLLTIATVRQYVLYQTNLTQSGSALC